MLFSIAKLKIFTTKRYESFAFNIGLTHTYLINVIITHMYNGISLILILPYKKVSWIRNKDGYMLYIGTTKFVDDDRFDLLPGNENQADLSTSKGGVDVTLRLRRVKDIDQGNFECQISTEPKLSKIFTLNVIGEYNMKSLNI